jgi:predicted secreted protein
MVDIYRNDRLIRGKIGTPVVLELESNPTTGYRWELVFDESRLRLIKREYQPATKKIGGSGVERFTLQPLVRGETTIRAEYKRPWETSSIEHREFSVRIAA